MPVMVVQAASQADRARAFVGHNRDRLNVTTHQVFFAELAAGDETARTIAQVCERAGVKLLKYPPQYGRFGVGESLAIGAIRSLVAKLGAMRARVVLQSLVAAKCAPVGADFIKAASELLYGPEYRGLLGEERLSEIVRGFAGAIPDEAVQFAASRKLPIWRALVVVIANKGGRRGPRAAA